MGQSNGSLAPRTTSSCPGPNNLPPLGFHADVHGDNIRISRDGRTAKRVESFCKGITFSSRPVRVNERVCVRFAEISNNWSGVIRFGFTYNDPALLRNALPKYACPELTNKPGYWAKALNERFCERDNVLFFYVNSSGDVHFGVNGEEKGVFITGVETRSPLWAIIDVYGNCTSIEFIDSRSYMYQSQHQQGQTQNHYHHHRQSVTVVEQELDNIIPSVQSMNVRDDYSLQIPAIRYNHEEVSRLTPVPFHKTKGRNVRLSPDHCIATRVDTDFCQGYVFTARPLRIGEKLIVQILRTERMYVGALALGLTSCDPATLVPADLPEDCDLLLDRPEYWVVSKDVASTPKLGDEISFCVTHIGEVQISKNGGPPATVMHVDQSLKLWAFLDVYGSTQSVRVLSQPPSPHHAAVVQSHQPHQIAPHVMPPPIALNNPNSVPASQMSNSPRRLQVSLPNSESANSLNGHVEATRKILPPSQIPKPSRVINIPSNDMIQLNPGGTVLVVNLPPPTNGDIQSISAQQPRISQVPSTPGVAASSSNMMPACGGAYVEPVTPAYQSLPIWQDMINDQQHTTGADCTICYENAIDSVLYMCGHMCMCYNCAIKQWRGIGGGQCPLCRAVIRDVIRTYKS